MINSSWDHRGATASLEPSKACGSARSPKSAQKSPRGPAEFLGFSVPVVPLKPQETNLGGEICAALLKVNNFWWLNTENPVGKKLKS